MKNSIIIILILTVMLSACRPKEQADQIIATPTSEVIVTPIDEAEDNNISEKQDEENEGLIAIYLDSTINSEIENLLGYKGKDYFLNHVHSGVLADLNNDEAYEHYYNYVAASGIGLSGVASYDFATGNLRIVYSEYWQSFSIYLYENQLYILLESNLNPKVKGGGGVYKVEFDGNKYTLLEVDDEVSKSVYLEADNRTKTKEIKDINN